MSQILSETLHSLESLKSINNVFTSCLQSFNRGRAHKDQQIQHHSQLPTLHWTASTSKFSQPFGEWGHNLLRNVVIQSWMWSFKAESQQLWVCLLKPSMCDRLDWGEGYTSCVGGFTSIEMRLIFGKTRSNLKYILDSLFYLAGSQAPYIHVILSYIVSITIYINQPLVRVLLHIINPQLVWYHLHRFVLCNDLIEFPVRMFSFKSEYISPYSISTLPLNWTILW